MKELNKKQKIIIVCFCSILIGIIIYYIYINKEKNNFDEIIQYDEENNNIEENINIEQDKISEITIYITGAVNKPGVYTLKKGSRITDAVELAQGVRDDADTEQVNLASLLEDEMQIIIPQKQENNKEQNINIVNNNTQQKDKKININTATQEELETLTGIGSSTASKIIEYRKEEGNFKKIEDIKNVKGIGESKYNSIKDKICIK